MEISQSRKENICNNSGNTEEKPIKCDQCHKTYENKLKLRQHMRNHAKKRCCCDLCDRVFRFPCEVELHKKTVHIEDRVYVCDLKSIKCNQCHKTYENKLKFRTHLRDHKEKRCYCDLCDRVFMFPYQVELHKKTVHIKDHVYVCDVCEKGFVTKGMLDCHRQTHFNNYKFKCDKCDSGFTSQIALQRHVDVQHRGVRFKCDNCDKSFMDEHYFKKHVLSHSPGFVRKEYKCNICSKILLRLTSYADHMRAHKGKGKKHICDICGKSVTTIGSLKDHMMTHSGEKPFVCNCCGKRFINKKSLVVHERTHTKEKPYICNLCLKSFSQRITLTVHMRSHTGERPYQCQICGKDFVTKTILKNHCKIHGRPIEYMA